MYLCSKQSSLFSFYALPSGGKLKGAVVHLKARWSIERLHTTWALHKEKSLASQNHLRKSFKSQIKVLLWFFL